MTDRRELREKMLIGELSGYGWRISPDKRTMRKYTQEEIEGIEASTAGEEVLAQLAERRSASYPYTPYTCHLTPSEQAEMLKSFTLPEGWPDSLPPMTPPRNDTEEYIKRQKQINADNTLSAEQWWLKTRRNLICNNYCTSHVDDDGTEYIQYGHVKLKLRSAQPKTLFGRMRKWLRGGES